MKQTLQLALQLTGVVTLLAAIPGVAGAQEYPARYMGSEAILAMAPNGAVINAFKRRGSGPR